MADTSEFGPSPLLPLVGITLRAFQPPRMTTLDLAKVSHIDADGVLTEAQCLVTLPADAFRQVATAADLAAREVNAARAEQGLWERCEYQAWGEVR